MLRLIGFLPVLAANTWANQVTNHVIEVVLLREKDPYFSDFSFTEICLLGISPSLVDVSHYSWPIGVHGQYASSLDRSLTRGNAPFMDNVVVYQCPLAVHYSDLIIVSYAFKKGSDLSDSRVKVGFRVVLWVG